MSDDALYVYGIVENSFCNEWSEIGLERKEAYTINEGNFNALVHKCKEKAYISKDPKKIKEMILSHNLVLDKAMEDFNGVIPMHFNTIIKRGKSSAQSSLKMWISENQENLQSIWSRVKGKREYGIRIYYDKNRLFQEVSNENSVRELELLSNEKSQGLRYLMQTKVKSTINEIMLSKVIESKKEFHNEINKITKDVIENNTIILLAEEKDLLMSLSILVDNQQLEEIKKILLYDVFSFQFVGPFAPYSFVNNDTRQ